MEPRMDARKGQDNTEEVSLEGVPASREIQEEAIAHLNIIADAVVAAGKPIPTEEMTIIRSAMMVPTPAKLAQARNALKEILKTLPVEDSREADAEKVVQALSLNYSLEKLAELLKIIKNELEKAKEEAKTRTQKHYMNNFWMKIPYQEGLSGESRYVQNLDAIMAAADRKSEIYRNISYRQFMDTLLEVMDRLTREGKVDKQKIQETINTIVSERGKPAGLKALTRIEDMIEPVYIEMRLLGFSRTDLWT